MQSLHFMRILAVSIPNWEAMGWVVVGGHRSPSVGVCVLIEWGGDDAPVVPATRPDCDLTLVRTVTAQ